ncbi:hypothetical protein HK102_006162, partial [Quaeritorhiza haematococci]
MLRSYGLTHAKCFCYEPPGSILSEHAAEYFESFVTSVILGDDLVPRLSRNAMDILKCHISELLYRCDYPKWQILGSVVSNSCCWRVRTKRPKIVLPRGVVGRLRRQSRQVSPHNTVPRNNRDNKDSKEKDGGGDGTAPPSLVN